MNNKHWAMPVMLLATCVLGGGVAAAGDKDSGFVLAEVDGVQLTRADFERKSPGRLFQARNTFYEAERKAVDEFIESYLLERQAKKRGLTVEALLEQEVNSKLPPDPSDEALRVYFEGVDTAETFEAVKDKINEHLRQRRIAKLKTAYIQALRKEAQVDIRLAPPRAEVSLMDTPLRGPQDAPVVLVEYADYECPYCQQIQPALDKLEAEYKGKLAFAYKDVPLPIHGNAQKASEATHCAGVQGKYWEFHDRLLTSKQLALPELKQHARALNLDAAAFDSCLDSGQQAPKVQAHVAEAQALGLQGTPSFFINGRFFSGLLTYEQLRDIVEEELKKLPGGKLSAGAQVADKNNK